jgi:acyl-ACP thioesterase
MLAIYEEAISVPFSGVDAANRMKLSTAFDFFQDAANKHAILLGAGRGDLERQGRVWILSRMSVFMERRPQWNEELTMRTWPRGSQKIFAIRDYDLVDREGRSPVRGRSGWIIVDIETKRPIRPEALLNTLPGNDGLDALPDGAGPVPAAEGAVKLAERRAAYTDIDMNGHVNNARYIEWIEDALESSLFYGAERLRLDINYIAELVLNETVEIMTAPGPDASVLIEGRKDAAGQPNFRARLWASGGA